MKMWFMDGETVVKLDPSGVLLRKDQESTPNLKVGDRFFDCANGRWATLIRIRPEEEALGAPFEALYDGCERFSSFIGTAMYCDIGEVISESR